MHLHDRRVSKIACVSARAVIAKIARDRFERAAVYPTVIYFFSLALKKILCQK